MTSSRASCKNSTQENPDLTQFVLDFLHKRETQACDPVFQLLQGDGSKRTFWRVSTFSPDKSFIAMANPAIDASAIAENNAYLRIGEHLRTKGIPIPEIYCFDLQKGWFLMEDMGEISLQDYVLTSDDPMPVYKEVLRNLISLQIKGAEDFHSRWCCQTERYDRKVMLHYEADYFTRAFLHGYLHLKKEWPELHPSFEYLADKASEADSSFFMHRDFQSRNIMMSQDRPGIIDWQGGRFGPLGYDLASLIIDPYTNLSGQKREAILEEYLRLLDECRPDLTHSFMGHFYHLAILRNLQILGAFSYLSRVMGKTYFEAYIPVAAKRLRELVGEISNAKIHPLGELMEDIEMNLISQ
jgi:aminoglycoside/choline kinase family phosphotransferase